MLWNFLKSSNPFLHFDEANGASEDTSPGQDNDNPNNCHVYDNVNGIDSGNVDDDLDMVDRCARGSHPGGCIGDDWLKEECCVKCNSGSGKVLVCSENGCPVAFHEACLTWQPDFDDKGKFYCPYCLFKQEGERVKELRMKSLSAGKELSDWTSLRRDGGNEEKQESKKPISEEKPDDQTAHGFDHVEDGETVEDERVNLVGASVSENEKKASSGDCENGLNNDDKETIHHNHDEIQGVESMNKENSDEGRISIADGFENVGNGERMEDDIEKSSDTEDDSPDLVSKTLVAGKKHDEQAGHGFDNVENGERIEEAEEHERVNLEGASVSETTKETNYGDCGKGLNNDDKETSHHNPNETQGVVSINKEKSDEGSIYVADGFENVRNRKMIDEDIEYSFDTEDDSPGLVSKTLVADKKHDEQTADKALSPQVVSTDKSSFQPSTSAKNTNMNREGKTVTVKISAGRRKSSEQPTIPIMRGTEKRRRLNQTAEEDMLKTSVSATAKKASAGDCQNGLNNDDKETSHRNPDETQSVEPMNKEKSDEGSNPGADGSMNKEKYNEGSISGADKFENVGNGERMEGKKHDEQTADKAQSPQVVSTDKLSFQPSTSAKNTNMNREGQTVPVKISAGRRKSSEQPTIPIMRDTEKRRRLNRTAEEEDMLKTSVSATAKKASAGDCENGLNNDNKETSNRNPDETQGVDPMNKENSDEGSNPGADGSMNKEKSDEGSISGANEFENVRNGERMEGKKHDEQTADKARSPQVVSTDKSLFQPSTSAKNTNMNREEQTIPVKISAGCRKSSEHPTIPIMRGTEKRRRLNRTAEEEDMVKTSVSATAKKASAGDCQNGLNNDNKETSNRNPDETQGVEPMNKEKSDEGSNPGADGSMNKEKSDEGSISGADEFENVGNGERMEGKKHDEQTADKAQSPQVVSTDKSSFQPSTSAKNMNMNREGQTVPVKISAGHRKSSEQPKIPIMGGTEKRRRLHWTAEEEDMLKDLVQEFSMKVNKNIPWRKILERGRSVFHSTRMPADLKDKWKNIVAKEISKG